MRESLRSRVIKLAYANYDLRADLLPLLKQGASMKLLLEQVAQLVAPNQDRFWELWAADDLTGIDQLLQQHHVHRHPTVQRFWSLM